MKKTIVEKSFRSGWKLSVLIIVLLFLSCGRGEEVFREYTEITSKTRFGESGLNSGGGQVSSREVDLFSRVSSPRPLAQGILWTTPKGWTEVKETGVRLVSFRTRSGLEVTLIPFPGNVGGIRANLLRWLGQVNVSLSEDELNGFIDNLTVGKSEVGTELSYILVDFESFPAIAEKNQNNTTIAAIFGFSDQMLFVKLSGEKDSVRQDKSDFLSFLQAIRLKST